MAADSKVAVRMAEKKEIAVRVATERRGKGLSEWQWTEMWLTE